MFQPHELDESELNQNEETRSHQIHACPHRRVRRVVGDSPQRGLQRGLHERSQHEKRLQIVANGALHVAVMFYRATAQQARLVD